MNRFEYLVCVQQYGRATYVNRMWNGKKLVDEPTTDDLEDCPFIHEFLNEKGAEGWELSAVVNVRGDKEEVSHTLYLKRAR